MGELTSKYESFGLTMETCTIYKLLNKSLSIPEYQRPYEWSERLVTKLFEDINKHFFTNGSDKPNNTNFYLGSILLHRDDKYINNIIDGQQRLVTLLIGYFGLLVPPFSVQMMPLTFLCLGLLKDHLQS